MYDTLKKILDNKIIISRGVAKRRRQYKNTYNPESINIEYFEENQDMDQSFYFSENQNLQLLGANFLKANGSEDSPTKLNCKELDVVIEMILQNKKAADIISMITRIQDKDT